MLLAGPLRTAVAASIAGRTMYRAGGGSSAGHDAHRRDLLDHDVVRWHCIFSFDVVKPGLDLSQPSRVLLEFLFQLARRSASMPRSSSTVIPLSSLPAWANSPMLNMRRA
jgi:hypothetical protein